MEQGSAINGCHRVQAVLNPRGDTEVRTGASQTPEEVRILLRTALKNLAARGHYLDPCHVVAGKAILADQPTITATERETSDPGGGGHPERRSEPVFLCCAIKFTELEAGLSARDSAGRVDFDPFHRG